MRIIKALWRRAGGMALHRIHGDTLTAPDGQIFDVPSGFHHGDYYRLAAGRYEYDETQILRRFFQPDNVIIEAGANIGVTARYGFLEKLKGGGAYICIEPNPNSLETLAKNMRRAQNLAPGKQFHIIAAAICEPAQDGGTGAFVRRRNLSSGLASHVRKSARETTIPVALRSLSGIMAEHNVGRASLVCDAEGAEHLIIQDRAALARIGQVMIELHELALTGLPQTPDDLLASFKELGFGRHDRIGHSHYLARAL